MPLGLVSNYLKKFPLNIHMVIWACTALLHSSYNCKMQCFIFIFLYDVIHAKFLSNYRMNYLSNNITLYNMFFQYVSALHTQQHYIFQYFIVQMIFIKKSDLHYRISSIKILHSRHAPNVFSHNYFVFHKSSFDFHAYFDISESRTKPILILELMLNHAYSANTLK